MRTWSVRSRPRGSWSPEDDPLDVVALMVATGGAVIWTRGHRVPDETTDRGVDPADWVRGRFEAVGFVEIAFVRPKDATFRVGVEHQKKVVEQELPQQLFSFVR